MAGNEAAMQAMAVKYLKLAGEATDPREREKLLQYVSLYRDMAAQANAPREGSSASLAQRVNWMALPSPYRM